MFICKCFENTFVVVFLVACTWYFFFVVVAKAAGEMRVERKKGHFSVSAVFARMWGKNALQQKSFCE